MRIESVVAAMQPLFVIIAARELIKDEEVGFNAQTSPPQLRAAIEEAVTAGY